MTKREAANVVIDSLERVATPREYYLLNHAGLEQMDELARFLVGWCASVGVVIEIDPGRDTF